VKKKDKDGLKKKKNWHLIQYETSYEYVKWFEAFRSLWFLQEFEVVTKI
jgi:hypothetical protein